MSRDHNVMLFECKSVQVFWKIIERMICHVFQTEVITDNVCMRTGFDIANEKNVMIHLIINFAQYVIYKDHVKMLWKTRVTAIAKALWIILSLNCVSNFDLWIFRKYYDSREVYL